MEVQILSCPHSLFSGMWDNGSPHASGACSPSSILGIPTIMNFQEYFKNKKITVIGLGLLGRGVGDVKFLAECGADLTVTDLKTEEELVSSLEQLKDFKNIKFVLGEHKLENFQPENCDLVIKAAGIPFNSPFIEEAKKNNIPVKMSASLFAEMYPGTIIGVTGTRGKSTVTAMIAKILKDAGLKTFLGGNVRGVSTLAHLPDVSADEFAVLELDSWQLQGFGDEKISPHVAVFTTFFPDHLNYYHNDLDLYMKDKANIFKYQGAEDFLILGEQVAPTILSKYENEINSKMLVTGAEKWNLKIPGEHNLYNASLAAKATKALGIDERIIKKALENFEGVSGRLELAKEIDGVKIYNDTTSTTPTSTITALKALGSEKKNIVLIIGGNDKNLEITELLEVIPQFSKAVIAIPGTGTEKMLETWSIEHKTSNSEMLQVTCYKLHDLKEALEKSFEIAESGDIILFSPAFTSFGQFKNEYDRGDKFMELLNKL